MASAPRADPRYLRPLATMDPTVIALRAWSRIAEDLGAKPVRATNRMREPLWRSFPAMLDLESDLCLPWPLDLWDVAPVPARASRVRETRADKVLKANATGRFDAAHGLSVLGQQPVMVTDGTAQAAQAHITTLIARTRLSNRQIGQAHRGLEQLTSQLADSQESAPGPVKVHDAEILASLPGVGRIVLATRLAEAFDCPAAT